MKKIASIVAFAIFGVAGAANAAVTGNCSTRYMPPLREPQLVQSFGKAALGSLEGYVNKTDNSAQESELHIVVVRGGGGTVEVSPSPKPVTLVLVGHEPGNWTLRPAPDAHIAKVFLAGPGQTVDGLPDGVDTRPIEICYDWTNSWQNPDPGVHFMPAMFKRLLRRVQAATGLSETSFQGGNDTEKTFEVPPRLEAFPRGETIAKPGEPRIEKVWDASVVVPQYETVAAQIPPEQRSPLALLVDLMRRGKFPALLPVTLGESEPAGPAALVPLPFTEAKAAEKVTADSKCNAGVKWFRASTEGDTLSCAGGGIFYASGPGSHSFKDAFGDDVVYPGTAWDTLDLGRGSDVVVLDVGWGEDVVSKTCGDASLDDSNRQRLAWAYQYNSFIVFGPGIRPEDMQWESKSVLVHVPTKSRLTLKNDCFNLVFSEPGILAEYAPPAAPQSAPQPIRPVAVAPVPQDTAALLLRAEQSVIDAYISGKAPADVTIDVDRPTFDGLGRAADAHYSNGIGKLVRLSDQTLLLVFATTSGRGALLIRLAH